MFVFSHWGLGAMSVQQPLTAQPSGAQLSPVNTDDHTVGSGLSTHLGPSGGCGCNASWVHQGLEPLHWD